MQTDQKHLMCALQVVCKAFNLPTIGDPAEDTMEAWKRRIYAELERRELIKPRSAVSAADTATAG